MAAREGPRRQRQARRPREHPGRREPAQSTATSAPSSSSSARPTSSPAATSSRPRPTRWRRSSSPRATTRSPSAPAELEELKITLKENIELGEVVRIEAADGNVIDSYQHIQGGRGVNGVLVEIAGGTAELAHDIAVHIAFARPKYLQPRRRPRRRGRRRARDARDDHAATRASPKRRSRRSSRAACNGFFKDVALLDQPYAKDDKQSVDPGARRRRRSSSFAQVEIG